ncbi:MAG TPA: hypothetical protein VIM71_07305 [Lacunisphaera sp.]
MNSADPAASDSKSVPTAAWALLVVAVLVNLWLVTRHWTDNLLDAHEFRQVQTAITADAIKDHGFALAYETPLLGPPWSVPMEFPTYQLGVATLSRATGLPLEQAGRLLSILGFYTGLPAVWLLLARWGLSPLVRICASAFILTCPILVFYSRTFMIESTALCLGLWFLWSFWRAVGERSWRTLPLVWIFGTLAGLTKVTTFALFCVAAGLVTLVSTLGWINRRPAIRSWTSGWIALAGLLVPLLAGIGWVAYSDHLKELNPYAGFIISANLHEWNWGTLAQRFKPDFWDTIYRVTSLDVASEPALVLLLATCMGAVSSIRWRIIICLGLYLSGSLLFANLYFVHDYYSYATACFLSIALGVAAGSLLEQGKVVRRTAWAFLILALLAQVGTFWRGYGNFYKRPNASAPAFAEIIKRTTAPADVLVAFGLDWNGVIPYHAHRRALMVPNHMLDDRAAYKKSLAGFGDLKTGALIIAGTLRNSPEFIIPRLRQFDMEDFPVASTDDMDLYLRKDLHARARSDLRDNHYPGVVFQLERKPVHLDESTAVALTGEDWRGKFPMYQPAPDAYRSPFHPVTDEIDGHPVIRTHAPMEFLFRAPTGARQVEAIGAMVREAYNNGNATDGVILQILEEFPDGRRQLLAERELKPMTRPEDRAEVTLQYTSPKPYRGVIVLRVDPGQMGVINCDWGYWRSVKIK